MFFKDPGVTTRIYYYRAGSAASRLGPRTSVPEARITHLSGITPALSGSCAALIAAVVFVGLDEAATLWNVSEPVDLRKLRIVGDVAILAGNP